MGVNGAYRTSDLYVAARLENRPCLPLRYSRRQYPKYVKGLPGGLSELHGAIY